MKFFMETVGCVRRNLEAQKIYDYLVRNGYTLVSAEEADLIIVTTCGFNDIKEKQSWDCVNRYRKMKGKLVVVGCLSGMSPSVVEKFPNVTFLPPANLGQIKDVLGLSEDFDAFKDSGMVEVRDKMCIQISTGCMGECTYCGIRRAVGRVKSRSVEAVLKDLRSGLDQGHTLFYFASDDVGCYGLDMGTNIKELLEEVFAVNAQFKVVMRDFSPRWLIRFRLEDLLIQNLTKVATVDFPIQSGSNRILELMKRHYTIEDVEKHLNLLCKQIPVTSQFIVGFPTETEQDFEATYKVVQRLGLVDILISLYSEKEEMESGDLHPKVPQKTKEQRAARLRELRMGMRWNRPRINTLPIL
jgi:MiaB/RimO family radical SAM methylthiotransferase